MFRCFFFIISMLLNCSHAYAMDKEIRSAQRNGVEIRQAEEQDSPIKRALKEEVASLQRISLSHKMNSQMASKLLSDTYNRLLIREEEVRRLRQLCPPQATQSGSQPPPQASVAMGANIPNPRSPHKMVALSQTVDPGPQARVSHGLKASADRPVQQHQALHIPQGAVGSAEQVPSSNVPATRRNAAHALPQYGPVAAPQVVESRPQALAPRSSPTRVGRSSLGHRVEIPPTAGSTLGSSSHQDSAVVQTDAQQLAMLGIPKTVRSGPQVHASHGAATAGVPNALGATEQVPSSGAPVVRGGTTRSFPQHGVAAAPQAIGSELRTFPPHEHAAHPGEPYAFQSHAKAAAASQAFRTKLQVHASQVSGSTEPMPSLYVHATAGGIPHSHGQNKELVGLKVAGSELQTFLPHGHAAPVGIPSSLEQPMGLAVSHAVRSGLQMPFSHAPSALADRHSFLQQYGTVVAPQAIIGSALESSSSQVHAVPGYAPSLLQPHQATSQIIGSGPQSHARRALAAWEDIPSSLQQHGAIEAPQVAGSRPQAHASHGSATAAGRSSSFQPFRTAAFSSASGSAEQVPSSGVTAARGTTTHTVPQHKPAVVPQVVGSESSHSRGSVIPRTSHLAQHHVEFGMNQTAGAQPQLYAAQMDPFPSYQYPMALPTAYAAHSELGSHPAQGSWVQDSSHSPEQYAGLAGGSAAGVQPQSLSQLYRVLRGESSSPSPADGGGYTPHHAGSFSPAALPGADSSSIEEEDEFRSDSPVSVQSLLEQESGVEPLRTHSMPSSRPSSSHLQRQKPLARHSARARSLSVSPQVLDKPQQNDTERWAERVERSPAAAEPDFETDSQEEELPKAMHVQRTTKKAEVAMKAAQKAKAAKEAAERAKSAVQAIERFQLRPVSATEVNLRKYAVEKAHKKAKAAQEAAKKATSAQKAAQYGRVQRSQTSRWSPPCYPTKPNSDEEKNRLRLAQNRQKALGPNAITKKMIDSAIPAWSRAVLRPATAPTNTH